MMTTTTGQTDAAVSTTVRDDAGESTRPRSRSRTQREEGSRPHGIGAWSDQPLTLEVAAREWMWLYDHRRGISLAEIAGYERLSIDEVRFGVERSKAQESKLSKDDLIETLKSGRLGDVGFRLTPLFPIGVFTPQSTCPHHEPLKQGARLCCMVCHTSGMDDHPGLRRDPHAARSPEPEPEPASEVAAAPSVAAPETRKQRRRRQLDEARAAQARL